MSASIEPTSRIPVATPPTRARASRLSAFQELGLVGVILVMGVLLSIYGYYDARPGADNTFLNGENFIQGIATPMSYYAIMAMGMTVVIISGGIDISVGSIMALSGLIAAWVMEQPWVGRQPPAVVVALSIALPLGVGLLCGLVNGGLVVGLRMHPFIVTLGTLSIFRGIANVLPFGFKTLPTAGRPLPAWSATQLFKYEFFKNAAGNGLALWPLIVTLVVIGIGYVYLRHSVRGRETYAIGGNEEAARFSGINVRGVKLLVYAISGLLAGLAGLVSLGRFGTVSTDTGQGYELTVVAAAVVGGASLVGGRGTAIGALFGTLILSMIENAINVLHRDQEYKTIIVGLSIIIAVALDRLGEAIRARRLAGARRK